MNKGNNEAVAWVCESEGAKELFAQLVPTEECSEDTKCSWCSLKLGYRAQSLCSWPGSEGGPILVNGVALWPYPSCERGEKCEFCAMDQKEWEDFLIKKMEERDSEAKAATEAYLADGIARLREMKCSGLEAHNNSIDLCIATFTEIFNNGADEQNSVKTEWHDISHAAPDVPGVPSRTSIIAYDDTSEWEKADTTTTTIELRGKESGIKYKISINFKANRARILSKRIDEILLANSEYPVSEGVLRGFVNASEFLSFNVGREDVDGGWDHLCIDPSGEFGVWPGDDVAALIMCLYDDLNTALDPAMYTLRHGMRDASKIAFMNGNSKSSINRLMAYDSAYEKVQEFSKSMSSRSLYSLVSKLKHNFSDPEFGNDPSSQIDYEMLQDEAWEGVWNE